MTTSDGVSGRRLNAQIHGVAALCSLSRAFKNVELPAKLTWERLSALSTISRHGPISISELSALEHVTPPTMSRMVAALQADALVRRAAHRHDRRSVLVTTTAKGRAAVEDGAARTLKRVLVTLGTLDAAALGAVLDLITQARDSMTRG